MFLIAFATYFSWLELHRFANYQLDAHPYSTDYGIFDELSRNLLRHGTLYNRHDGNSQMGEHFSPLWYLLALIYVPADDLRMLLLAKVILLTIAGIPLMLFAWQRLRAAYPVAAIVLAYCLYPPLQQAIVCSFNIELFVIPALCFALYFFARQRKFAFAVCLALVAVNKENYILTAGALALLAVSRPGWRRFGLLLLCGLAAYFAAILLLIIPAFNPFPVVPVVSDLYGHFGASPAAVAVTILTQPWRALAQVVHAWNGAYVAWLGLPALFGFCLSPCSLLLMLPEFFVTHLSNNPAHRSPELFYFVGFIPFIMFGLVDGIARARRRFPAAAGQRRVTNYFATLLLIAAVASSLCSGFLPWSAAGAELARPNPDAGALAAALAAIPPAATVFAPATVALHLPPGQRNYAPPLLPAAGPDFILAYLDYDLRRTDEGLLLLQQLAALSRQGYVCRAPGPFVWLFARNQPASASAIDSRVASAVEQAFAICWQLRGNDAASRHRASLLSPRTVRTAPWRYEPLRWGPCSPLLVGVRGATLSPEPRFYELRVADSRATVLARLAISPDTALLAVPLPRSAALPQGPQSIFLSALRTDGSSETIELPVVIDSLPPLITVNRQHYGPFSADPGSVFDVDFSDSTSQIVWWYAVDRPDDARYRATLEEYFTNNCRTDSFTADWPLADWDKLPPGEHTVYCWAFDRAGNTADPVSFTVSKTP